MAHFVVQANFAEGNMDRAREVAARAIDKRPLVKYYDAEFPLWSTMDCFMRWKDVPGAYTDELKKKTRDYVAAAKGPSDAITYNHHWMLAAGLILAYQEWGDEAISYRFSKKDAPDARIDETTSGRIHLHYGTVMIGLHVSEPFEVQRHGKVLQFTIPARGDRLAVGYAVETASPGDYPGVAAHEQLAAFAHKTNPSFDKLQLQTIGDFPTVTYTAVDETPLRLGWRPKGTSSLREIGGAPIPSIEDNAQWPLLDTPYLKQSVNGNLTVRTKDGEIEYDFTNWKITGP